MMGHANTKNYIAQSKKNVFPFFKTVPQTTVKQDYVEQKKCFIHLHLFLGSHNMSFFIYSGCFVLPTMHFPRCARNHTATDPTDSAGAFSQIEAGL